MSDDYDDQADEGPGKWTELAIKYAGTGTVDLIRAMSIAKGKKERIEEELKIAQKEFDFLRLIAVPTNFEDNEIKAMKVDGIGRVSLTGDMQVSILKANKAAVFEFFRDIGKGALIQEGIPPSTLKATCKAMMIAGEELPDTIKITPFTRASITKA